MQKQFITKKEGELFYIVSSKTGKVIASLKIKEWETEFFKRKFGTLSIDHTAMDSLASEAIHDVIDSLLLHADENQYDLIELHLDIFGINLVPILEEKGFRLVDTRITFITLMEKKLVEKFSTDIGKMCFAKKSDLEDILRLTHQAFTKNPSFFSRFTYKTYFTQEETKRYYSAWIENHLEEKNTLFAVWKIDDKVIGYFIYKRAGRFKGEPIYKCPLTAVAPEYRGHKAHLAMQSFLYDNFPEEKFYVDNTTQLTNFPTIKNHMIAQKKLNRIELTFYRSKVL